MKNIKKSKFKIILVISIIVLILISVFVILVLIGNNPINNIKKATSKQLPTVTFETNGSSNAIEVSTKVNVEDKNGNGLNNSTLEYVWDTQNTIEPVEGWKLFASGENLTKTETGTYYLWIKASDNNGNKVVSKSNIFIIGEVDLLPARAVQTENKTFKGETTGFSYNNPVIPTGFIAINTTISSWDNLSQDFDKGLVIQDEKGNQFVWVPVDGTNVKYAKNLKYPYWCDTPPGATVSDILPKGISNESTQINKYQGFYVARYESGNESNNLVIKKDMIVWNNISHASARSKSEEMYSTSYVKSGLVTGSQWDTIMKWIENSGKNVTTDSKAWGNYANSSGTVNIVQKTGYSNKWKTKNIYDLAGNTYEWTNEKNSSDFIYRGGSYNTSGTDTPAAFRQSYIGSTVSNSDISFRVVLYVE